MTFSKSEIFPQVPRLCHGIS